jgi:hypothetical protein
VPETSNEKIFVEITLNDDISSKFESIQKTAKASADELAKAFDDGRNKLLLEISRQITIVDRLHEKLGKSLRYDDKPKVVKIQNGRDLNVLYQSLKQDLQNGKLLLYEFGMIKERGFKGIRPPQNFSGTSRVDDKPKVPIMQNGRDLNALYESLDEQLTSGKISKYEFDLLKERGYKGLRPPETDNSESIQFSMKRAYKLLVDWAESYLNSKTKDNWTVPKSAMNPGGDNIWDADNVGLLRHVKNPEEIRYNLGSQSELIKDIIQGSLVASIGFENLSSALAESLSLIRINLSENASAMEKIWGGMINAMIEDIASLVSQWLVMNTIAGIFGLGTGFGAVAFESLLGIPKLAGGGDFIVPSGFPNDSYPILVQSGERVRVTPSNSTAPETKLLSEIRDALYALNLNTASGTRPNPISLKLFIDGREIIKSSDSAQRMLNREGRIG